MEAEAEAESRQRKIALMLCCVPLRDEDPLTNRQQQIGSLFGEEECR